MSQNRAQHTGSEKIGYARVSSATQNLDSQLDALRAVGCTTFFSDKSSGASRDRPEWNKFLEYIRPGDTLVIAELSRMSRSLRHLLEVMDELEDKQVKLVSLRENIDTTTATGRCFVSMMGAVAQMERELKSERAAAGRASAKARGRSGGRPRTDPQKLEQARILYENSDMTAAQASKAAGISRRKLFEHIAQTKAQAP